MSENSFELIAIHCVDEIEKFTHLANSMEETLTEWHSAIDRKTGDLDEHKQQISDATLALSGAIHTAIDEQQQEYEEIMETIKRVTDQLHKLQSKADEQAAVLEVSMSFFGNSLKEILASQEEKHAKQEESHHQLVHGFEQHAAHFEEHGSMLQDLMGSIGSGLHEHRDSTDSLVHELHEQLEQHIHDTEEKLEHLTHHLEHVHDATQHHLHEQQEAIAHAVTHGAEALSEGFTQSLGLLGEAGAAIAEEFTGIHGKVRDRGSDYDEAISHVEDGLHALTQGLEKSVDVLDDMHKVLGKFL